MTTTSFRAITWELANASTLEALTLPLLATLETLTGLECTYLTRVGQRQRSQRVLFSHQSHPSALRVPPGFCVPWEGSLCKCALDGNIHYTMVAERLWPENTLTRDLGVRTFMSQPVRDRAGAIVGTLCAASGHKVPMVQDALAVVRLFSELIRIDLDHRKVLAIHQEQHEGRHVRIVDEALRDMADFGESLTGELSRAYGLSEAGSTPERMGRDA